MPSRVQRVTQAALHSIQRFLHIEAVSGGFLLLAAAVALVWANSPFAESYHALWHTTLSISLGSYAFSHDLHFWINDVLMTVFFLVVGMEIRREIHNGALSSLRMATLPIVAAIGGVVAPALIYMAWNWGSQERLAGWAIPTATDIAFAVGLLALLGRSIPATVRVFLLALAIIDDIIAVLIIAVFYSGGLEYMGFAISALGMLMIWALQRMGFGSALVYVIPGGIVWAGMLMTGAHPTLAGVVLGLATPVRALALGADPKSVIAQIGQKMAPLADKHQAAEAATQEDEGALSRYLQQLRLAQREMAPPVTRVQEALHPWVAFVIMPLFALANAGVNFSGLDVAAEGVHQVAFGVAVALVLGKPLGIIVISMLAIRMGLCAPPPGVNWAGVLLVGFLAGIGFTMSIFISMLAFPDSVYADAAKMGVLAGSLISGLLGLGWGLLYRAVRLRA